MRDEALALDCPAREPDPVLLMQLTALAAASTAPAIKPWWHRFTVKTGAAAVAGVLLISAATADAERATHRPRPQTIAEPIVHSTPSHRTARHKPAQTDPAQASSVDFPPAFVPMRHAGKRAHQRGHAHTKKHHDGNGSGGGNENGRGDVQFAPLAPTQGLSASQGWHGHSHPHGHVRKRDHSPH